MPGIWDKLTSHLVDTHCHVHHYQNKEEVTAGIAASGMKVHCVTVKPYEFAQCCELFKHTDNIIPCPGLFPLNVKEEQVNLNTFLESVSQAKFIGEIGLDYSISDEDELNLQKDVFKTILAHCDRQCGKVLSIHSRRSAKDVLKFIGSDFRGTAIMHWYSGDTDAVKKSPANIFYSINTAMIRSRQGKKVLQALRPEQVLTETDGPYVTINDQPAVPMDIRNVVSSLSVLWEVSIEKAVEILSDNYQRAVTFH